MTLAMRRPPGRWRSESPEFAPVPSVPPSLPAAAPVAETRQSRCSGGAVITRQVARRLAPARNHESPAGLQRPVWRSIRRQDFPKDTCGNIDGEILDHSVCYFCHCILLANPLDSEMLLLCELPLTSTLRLPPPGSRTSPAEGNEPDH